MPHSQFKAFLASRDNTIALIPLDDCPFNRCKSAIKFFDYCQAGVPCVCSAVTPYVEVIDDTRNGLLCGDGREEWVEAIRSLVLDAKQRAAMGQAARESCLKHHNLKLTAAAWQEMLCVTTKPEEVPVYQPRSQVPLPIRFRSRRQLLMRTTHHLFRFTSYESAWWLYREDGFAGVKDNWRTAVRRSSPLLLRLRQHQQIHVSACRILFFRRTQSAGWPESAARVKMVPVSNLRTRFRGRSVPRQLMDSENTQASVQQAPTPRDRAPAIIVKALLRLDPQAA